jgi:hypothetical protein
MAAAHVKGEAVNAGLPLLVKLRESLRVTGRNTPEEIVIRVSYNPAHVLGFDDLYKFTLDIA